MTSANSPQTWPTRNQGINPVTADVNFERALKRIAPDFHARRWAELVSFGDYVATTLKAQADYSDRVHPPVLTHDIIHPAQPGPRRGAVHLNDRYLAALQEPYVRKFFQGLTDDQNADRHLVLYCMQYLLGDISTGCPPAMAHPVVNAILKHGTPEIKALFVAQLTRTDGQAKTAGTWGTEPLSGTNIAQTVSEVVEQPDGTLRAFGLKWFTSNAGSGVALATMRKRGAGEGDKGIGLYIVPSHIDEHWQIRNEYDVVHLKEKMGTRALATGEIQLNGALVHELVPPGEGLRAMMEVLSCSRVHNAMAAAGMMRESIMETLCWATHRKPFNKPLIDEVPSQKRLIAMTTQWHAGTALAFEAARMYDVAEKSSAGTEGAEEAIWARLITALAKYRTADQAEWIAGRGKILHGAAGYVEDYPMTRINRDTQVLSVWEGPEQVQAKEVIRMIAGKQPGDEVYIRRLRSLSDALPDHDFALDKTNLNHRLRFLEDSFKYLRTQPKEAAVQVEDEYLDIMSHVAAYALLLQEAAWELQHEKDAKKYLIARQYHDDVLARVKMMPDFQASLLQKNFDALVKGTAIKPAP